MSDPFQNNPLIGQAQQFETDAEIVAGQKTIAANTVAEEVLAKRLSTGPMTLDIADDLYRRHDGRAYTDAARSFIQRLSR